MLPSALKMLVYAVIFISLGGLLCVAGRLMALRHPRGFARRVQRWLRRAFGPVALMGAGFASFALLLFLHGFFPDLF